MDPPAGHASGCLLGRVSRVGSCSQRRVGLAKRRRNRKVSIQIQPLLLSNDSETKPATASDYCVLKDCDPFREAKNAFRIPPSLSDSAEVGNRILLELAWRLCEMNGSGIALAGGTLLTCDRVADKTGTVRGSIPHTFAFRGNRCFSGKFPPKHQRWSFRRSIAGPGWRRHCTRPARRGEDRIGSPSVAKPGANTRPRHEDLLWDQRAVRWKNCESSLRAPMRKLLSRSPALTRARRAHHVFSDQSGSRAIPRPWRASGRADARRPPRESKDR